MRLVNIMGKNNEKGRATGPVQFVRGIPVTAGDRVSVHPLEC